MRDLINGFASYSTNSSNIIIGEFSVMIVLTKHMTKLTDFVVNIISCCSID